jgi:hypothetical protein
MPTRVTTDLTALPIRDSAGQRLLVRQQTVASLFPFSVISLDAVELHRTAESFQ